MIGLKKERCIMTSQKKIMKEKYLRLSESVVKNSGITIIFKVYF